MEGNNGASLLSGCVVGEGLAEKCVDCVLHLEWIGIVNLCEFYLFIKLSGTMHHATINRIYTAC